MGGAEIFFARKVGYFTSGGIVNPNIQCFELGRGMEGPKVREELFNLGPFDLDVLSDDFCTVWNGMTSPPQSPKNFTLWHNVKDNLPRLMGESRGFWMHPNYDSFLDENNEWMTMWAEKLGSAVKANSSLSVWFVTSLADTTFNAVDFIARERRKFLRFLRKFVKKLW